MIYVAKTAREERSQHNPWWCGHSVLSAPHAEHNGQTSRTGGSLSLLAVTLCQCRTGNGARIMSVCCRRKGDCLSTFLAPAGELVCGGDLNHGIPVFLSVRLWC